jgi:hypothetical protein
LQYSSTVALPDKSVHVVRTSRTNNIRTVKLFDDINRDYTGPASDAESDFSFLNRSARPPAQHMRDVLERWFADYPDEVEKSKLRSEFRSDDDSAHKEALFELYCYSLLRCQGFDVDLHQVADEREMAKVDSSLGRLRNDERADRRRHRSSGRDATPVARRREVSRDGPIASRPKN